MNEGELSVVDRCSCDGRPPRLLPPLASPRGQTGDAASITIDAAKVENRISPRVYGQFAEFMFENIKFGLHAELLRNRGFEETAPATSPQVCADGRRFLAYVTSLNPA